MSTPGGLLGRLRKLGTHSAVYGTADVFQRIVSMLLLPLYTSYLTPVDYRDLALLLTLTAVAKILFRLGLDGGFFRVYYDRDGAGQRRLAGSIALFSGLYAAVLLGAIAWAREPLAAALLGERPSRWVVIAAADVALSSLAFVPMNLLRIQDRPGYFSVLSGFRHALTILSKVVLVTAGFGVDGVLWADVFGTAAFTVALLPVLRRNADFRPDLSGLRAALAFGIPKTPHGFMVQVQNLADRKLLDFYVPPTVVGLYQLASTIGESVKFALSAFEPAWQPFVYSEQRNAEGARTLARVATWAWLAFVAAGLALAVLGRELLRLLTTPEFHAGAPVIPVIVLAFLLHGVFLLTSIGIGIRKQTGYYPLISTAAAVTNVGVNLALIPRFGMMGAAWATVASYAVMAGLGFRIGQRLYPMPLEGPRLARITLAALTTFALTQLSPDALWPAVLFKSAALLAFPALLWLSGFLRPEERERALQAIGARLRRR